MADTSGAATGLGALVGSLTTIVGAIAYFAGWLVNRHRRKHGYDPKTGAVAEDDPPPTPLLTEGELVKSLRSQLDEQDRLHGAEMRALRLQVRELDLELREERSKNAALTYATSKLREEYRRSLGLGSEAPPASPLSSSAKTVPPKR